MNLAQLLHRAAALYPDAPCLASGGDVLWSYREASRAVAVLAAGMQQELGLLPGERVAVYMPNRPEYLLVLFAAWHAGLVAVPINARLHTRELKWILQDCGARILVAAPDCSAGAAAGEAGCVRELIEIPGARWSALMRTTGTDMAAVPSYAMAWLFYTSGTTGRPKGAMLSHANLLSMTVSYLVDVEAVHAGESMIHCAPLSHGSGLYALPHIARGAVQVVPASGSFNAAETLALIQRWPQCSFFFAPTMVNRLIEYLAAQPDAGRQAAANLKTIVYGGAPMYTADLLGAMRAFGPKLAQIYGQGEAPMTITALTKQMHRECERAQRLDRLASVGLPRTEVEVHILDADGQQLPPGKVGEIVVRGPVVMSGYWHNAIATAETLRSGWLYTGDLGAFDEAGFLTLAGRSKDLIISGGHNIYPREVEDVLLQHDSVAEAAVVGRRHPDWGEELVAFVACRENEQPDAADLDRLCLEHLARYKRPRQYRFVAELPKNSYGKVLKTALRELAEADREAPR